MSFTRLLDNLNNIGSLPDKPVLTSEELKGAFDKSGNTIKEYINDVLIREIEEKLSKLNIDVNNSINMVKNSVNDRFKEKFEGIYHVGKVIVDMSNINPRTYLGFGEWVLIGQGRTLVGVDSSDNDFNVVKRTGGEKKHTLTVGEMASHCHSIHVAGTRLDANRNDLFRAQTYTSTSGGDFWNIGLARTGLGSHDAGITNTGGGQSHNNMQPYLTTYFWERVS